MGLLDGGIADTFASVFGDFFLTGTLHKVSRAEAQNGDVTTAILDYPVRVQVDQVSEAMRQAAGYTEKQQRLIVLQSGAGAMPTTQDRITAGGQVWAIASVEADPANSHWIIRGERA